MTKSIEDYTKLLVKILQEDVKDGKITIEKQESYMDQNNVVINFFFRPISCTKEIKVTFDYNELSKKINCSKTVLADNE